MSLTDLADEKVSFFDAAILIFSPLAGLRPSRSGVTLTSNLPNPDRDTSAPVAAASTMSLKNVLNDGLGLRFAYAMHLSDLAMSSVVFIAGVPSDFIRGVHGMAPALCHYCVRA
jgi:hypothetical protein